MNKLAMFRVSLLPVLMRIGRVGLALFALSLVLGALPAPSTTTAFAAAHVPAHRIQIDGSVQNFHMIDDQRALVLGNDNKLWLESGPFGIVPPARTLVAEGDNDVFFETRLDFQFLSNTQVVVLDHFIDELFLRVLINGTWVQGVVIDNDASSFQALSADQILVLGTDGKLWLEHGPFGTAPPARVQIDANVGSFQALSADQILVLGNDNKLWLEHGPFGNVPPGRVQIDANVGSFQALSADQILVLGVFDNRLWLERAPFGGGHIPPARTPIDANVKSFQALSADQIFVQGTDNKLWLTHGPFGSVPPARVQVDANVKDFEALSSTQVGVRGTDDKLWLVSAPFG